MMHLLHSENPWGFWRNVIRECPGAYSLKGPASPSPSGSRAGHIQEIVLRVAVEGAAEAHGVLHPSLVHLQVEPQSFAVVEYPHTHIGPHAQEHRGQPPNLKGVYAQNGEGM